MGLNEKTKGIFELKSQFEKQEFKDIRHAVQWIFSNINLTKANILVSIIPNVHLLHFFFNSAHVQSQKVTGHPVNLTNKYWV